jgi:hypothetical protein
MNPQSAEPSQNPIRHRNKIQIPEIQHPTFKIVFNPPSPTGTPPSPSATTRHQLLVTRLSGSAAIHHSPSKIQHPSHSNIQNPTSGDSVACYSINRAKGLERRAIILTGLPAWEECAKNDYQARTFLLGATRAQQLLAVLR